MAGASSTDQPVAAGQRSVGRAHSGRGPVVMIMVVIGCLALVLIGVAGAPPPPFDPDSSAPDGFLALRMVLEEQGIETRGVAVDDPLLDTVGRGVVLQVSEPDLLDARHLSTLAAAAERGATVVYGSVPPTSEQLAARGEWHNPDDPDQSEEQEGPDTFSYMARRELISGPADLLEPGLCTIPALADLGVLDVVSSTWPQPPFHDTPGIPVGAVVDGTCYGAGANAQFVQLSTGSGHVFVIGSPYLWVNARLKVDIPVDMMSGFESLPVPTGVDVIRADNAMTAWRVLSGAASGVDTTEVVFVDPGSGAGGAEGGSQGLFELMPLPFKAFAGMSLVAVALFIWSRGVRLGRPVPDELPVTIESSAMTAAMGRLFVDDQAFIDRGTRAIRREAIEDLATELGLGSAPDPTILCSVVAARTGRDSAEIADLLYGPAGKRTIIDVIDLERMIELLRMEVGHERPR